MKKSASVIFPLLAIFCLTAERADAAANFVYHEQSSVLGSPSLYLLRADSTKRHGDAGTFDILLFNALSARSGSNAKGTAPGLPPAIECRSPGPSNQHTLVFTFSNPLMSVGGATPTCGSIGSQMIDGSDAHRYIVNLTGATACNAQRVTVTLHDVQDLFGRTLATAETRVNLLLGDVTEDGAVSNTDVSSVKGQVAAPVTGSNFRNDVNGNGTISGTDVAATKGQVGATLP